VALNETGTVRAVADSDLSNAVSLRCVLQDRGHLVRGSTDAELIAHAYEEWGDACVERFAGPFACAVWDEIRRRLFLARDPFGVRPLCFAFHGRGLVFGSETTPLLQDPSVGREWQPQAIDAYLALGYVPAPFTIYRRISKLEAGQALVVDGRRLTTRCYSDVSDDECSHAGERERIDLAESSLRASVASFTDQPDACVLMSGGLASTAVAAMLPCGGTSVTVGIEQDPSDLDRVFRIAALLGLHSEIDIAVPDAADIVRQVACHFDEPAADPAAVSQYAVFAAARRYTDTALTGHGAAPLCDRPHTRRLFDEAMRNQLYTRRFAWQVLEGQAVALSNGDAYNSLPDSQLALADRTASAAGLRLRHPFLDRSLTATPTAVLRQIAARHLPASLLPPARGTAPDPRWLSQAVQSLVPQVLLGDRIDTRGIFSRPALQMLWQEHQRGAHDHTHRLWSLLMLEFWIREFIDGDAAAEPAEHAVLVRAA
jgi:asparagine synthetase B (glutamine-hydrolysing)